MVYSHPGACAFGYSVYDDREDRKIYPIGDPPVWCSEKSQQFDMAESCADMLEEHLLKQSLRGWYAISQFRTFYEIWRATALPESVVGVIFDFWSVISLPEV